MLASAASAFAPDLQPHDHARQFRAGRVAQFYAYVGTDLALGPIAGPSFGGIIQVAAVLDAMTARSLDGTMMPIAWAVFLMGPTMLISFYLLALRPRRVANRAA